MSRRFTCQKCRTTDFMDTRLNCGAETVRVCGHCRHENPIRHRKPSAKAERFEALLKEFLEA